MNWVADKTRGAAALSAKAFVQQNHDNNSKTEQGLNHKPQLTSWSADWQGPSSTSCIKTQHVRLPRTGPLRRAARPVDETARLSATSSTLASILVVNCNICKKKKYRLGIHHKSDQNSTCAYISDLKRWLNIDFFFRQGGLSSDTNSCLLQ